MLLLNLGYGWNLARDVENIDGVVILPTGNDSARLTRSPVGGFSKVLLDPQLYLAGLDANSCAKVCARLASFPWFNVSGLPVFDSSTMKRTQWNKASVAAVSERWPGRAPEGASIADAAMQAIEFQESIGCTHILLAVPLVDTREDEFSTQCDWIDAGLEAASELEVTGPVFVSVPIAETVLNDSAFAENGFLDSIVDQVSAREGVDGVYLVIAQSGAAEHPFESSPIVSRAYVHLASRFAQNAINVITNFADLCGLVCVGAGADGFATGQSQALRRLSLSGFRDDARGLPLPRLYANQSAGEFLTEDELTRIASAKMLRRVDDETIYSKSLLKALRAGRSAATVPAWAQSKNNVIQSHRHFLCRMAIQGIELGELPSRDARYDAVLAWLEAATANQAVLRKKWDQIGRLAPAAEWLELLSAVGGT